MNKNIFKLPNQLTHTSGVKILVYGGAGSRKTRMSATTSPNPIYVAIENGLLSIRDVQIPVYDCRNNPQAFGQFMNLIKTPTINQFQTIIIDSLSELSTLVLLQAQAKPSLDLRRAYGELADIMLKWVHELFNLKSHNVIFICKQECVVNNNSSYYQPSLEGRKLYSEITHLIDVVLRFHTKNLIINGKSVACEVATSKNSPTFIARDRSGRLAEDEPQDFTYLINKIKS